MSQKLPAVQRVMQASIIWTNKICRKLLTEDYDQLANKSKLWIVEVNQDLEMEHQVEAERDN